MHMKFLWSLPSGLQRRHSEAVSGSEQLKRYGYIVLLFEGLLGIAHLLWPEFTWGQGRDSYFNFSNNLTLASWLVSVQLLGIAILALIAFHRDQRTQTSDSGSGWPWLVGTLTALMLSICRDDAHSPASGGYWAGHRPTSTNNSSYSHWA